MQDEFNSNFKNEEFLENKNPHEQNKNENLQENAGEALEKNQGVQNDEQAPQTEPQSFESQQNFEQQFFNHENVPQGGGTKTKRGGVFVFYVVAAAAVLALIFGLINQFSNSKKKSPGQNKSKIEKIASKKKSFISKKSFVAKLFVTGVIQEKNEFYCQDWLLQTIADLKDDEENVGILLMIDSPGGTVFESDEAYLALLDYKKSGKPVWAYFESFAASGAYYIACSADKIFANRNTLLGSIGVIAGTSVDATEFLQKLGLKVKTFTAGKNKNMLNFDSPVTEEQEKIMQSIADECYDQFTEIVATARQLPLEKVRELADGRIYSAKQAKKNFLIDEISSSEDAQDAMRDFLQNDFEDAIEGEIDFYDFAYKYEPSFLESILRNFQSEKKFAEIKFPAYLWVK